MAEEENITGGGTAGLATLPDDDDGPDDADNNSIGQALLGAHIVTLDAPSNTSSYRPRRRSLVQEIEDKLETKAKHEVEKKVGKNILKRVWNKIVGGGAEEAAEGAAETAAEGAATGAAEGAVAETAAGSFVATSAAGIAATVGLAALDVGLAVYDTKKIIELVKDNKEWNAEKAAEAEGSITNFRREALTYFHSKIGDKGHYDIKGSVIHYANGKTVDLADPKVIDEVKEDLKAQEAEQQKIIDTNNSWVPDWIHNMYNSEAIGNKYLAEARMRELKSAEGGTELWRTAVANHQIPGASAPQGNVVSGRTFGVGDSFACGITNSCEGDPKDNLAVVGSHITTQGKLKGALEQLDGVMAQAKRGDKVLIHTGRNDLGEVNSDRYKANLDRMTREMKALQDMGVEVVWVLPPPSGDKDSAAVAKMAALQKEYAQKYSVHFKEIDTPVARAPDNIHPQSYDKLASTVTAGTGISVKGPDTSASPPHIPSHKANSNYSNITGSSSTSTAHLNVPFTERQKYAFDLLVQKGVQNHLSHQQSEIIAAGFVGNMVAESGANINDKAIGDGGSAHGIGQWHGDREKAFIQKHGYGLLDPRATIGQQVDFMWDEAFTGKEKDVGAHLLQAKSAREAGAIVSAEYERPAARDREAINRGQIAENMHNHFAGTGDTTLLASNSPRPASGARDRLPSGVVAELAPQPHHPPSKPGAPKEELHPVA